jgi:uncharacterized protein involved in response to NO
MTRDLLSYTFRLFFLLTGVSAIGLVLLWTLSLNGQITLSTGITPLYWHSHEMIVGFGMATVTGFALSAVATWTGRPAVHGSVVFWLVVCWVAGRIAVFYSNLVTPAGLIVLDMLFPAFLTMLFAREVFVARNKRNYKVVAIILVLCMLNLGFYTVDARQSLYLMIHTLLLLVVLIGGRIVPSFTSNWLRGRGESQLPVNNLLLDRVAITLTILTGLSDALVPNRTPTGWLAIAAAIAHAARIMQWHGLRTLSNPLLAILHVAYWWIPVGYAMLGLASLGLFLTPTAALHALTMGAIGTMVFAMITRVPLGHTARPLNASRLTVVAYGILTLAIVARIMSPLATANYITMINVAAIGWCFAFLIYIWVYWPVLTGPPGSP